MMKMKMMEKWMRIKAKDGGRRIPVRRHEKKKRAIQ